MTELKQFKCLMDFNNDEKQKFIDSFDIILTDCDGVIWELSKPIEGVGKAIDVLKENGKKVYYVTNNSVRNTVQYEKKFKESEINSSLEDVMHPAAAAVFYLKKHQFKGLVYIIGSKYFKQIVRDGGYEVIDGPHGEMEESFTTYMKLTYDKLPVKCVIIDTDFNCTSAKLSRAENYLKDPECIFMVGTTDMRIQVTKSFFIIGPGPYYKIVEEASGRRAIIIGKPGDALKDIVLEKFNIKDKNRVLFIGDMLEQDIGFGNKCGIRTLLVLTGGTTKEGLTNHKLQNELPDYYLNSFADFKKLYEEIKI